MKNFIKIAPSASFPSTHQKQNGAALLVTIFVLIALTIIAISVTSTNQSQAIMVRNNQFRLESFNSSYAEIDAQIDSLNTRKISDGVPSYIVRLIDGSVGAEVNSDASATSAEHLPKLSSIKDAYIQSKVAQQYQGNCLVFGQQVGAGEEKVACNELKIESDATLTNTNVVSTQHQVYEYRTLKQ